MAPRQRGREARSKNENRSGKAAYYLRYLEFLEKTCAVLISQANRLEAMSNSALCSVAGGAAGVFISSLYIAPQSLNDFAKIAACGALPVFMAVVGNMLGQLLPTKVGQGNRVHENLILHRQFEVQEEIDRTAAKLDALPKQRGYSAQREEYTQRLHDLRARGKSLADKLERLDSDNLSLTISEILSRRVSPVKRETAGEFEAEELNDDSQEDVGPIPPPIEPLSEPQPNGDAGEARWRPPDIPPAKPVPPVQHDEPPADGRPR